MCRLLSRSATAARSGGVTANFSQDVHLAVRRRRADPQLFTPYYHRRGALVHRRPTAVAIRGELQRRVPTTSMLLAEQALAEQARAGCVLT